MWCSALRSSSRVGLLDDAREISAPAKVAGQVLAAMFLVILGATMFWLKIPLAGTVVLSSDLTPLITAFWVIGITNAINLIDGLDGLAAGIVAIASGALAVYGTAPRRARRAPVHQPRAAHRRDHLRGLPRLPPAQLQPGEGVHGRCRCTFPRAC